MPAASWLSHSPGNPGSLPDLIPIKHVRTFIYMSLPEQPVYVHMRPANAINIGSLQSCASSLTFWHTDSSACFAAA